MSDESSYKNFLQDNEDCYFEVNLTSGIISWINSSLSKKCEFHGNKLIGIEVHGLVSENYREKCLEFQQELKNHDKPTSTIWPIPLSNGVTVWWKIEHVNSDNDFVLFKCSIRSKTTVGESAHDLLDSIATAYFNDSIFHINLNRFSDRMTKLNQEVADFKKSQLIVKENLKSAIGAATNAANAAIDNKSTTEKLQAMMSERFDQHTTEIMKLISTDAIHDERLRSYEERVRKITKNSLKNIVDQADKSEKKLNKGIVIPTGIIATILTIIQYIIMHYMKSKLVPWLHLSNHYLLDQWNQEGLFLRGEI